MHRELRAFAVSGAMAPLRMPSITEVSQRRRTVSTSRLRSLKRCRTGHVFDVDLMLCRKNLLVVVLVKVVLRQAREIVLFAGKRDCCSTGDAWTALQFANLVLGKFGSSTDQAHIAHQNIP